MDITAIDKPVMEPEICTGKERKNDKMNFTCCSYQDNDSSCKLFILYRIQPKVEYIQLPSAAKQIHEVLLFQSCNKGIHETEKYSQECQLLAGLYHPSITQFLGLGESQLPLLVMEQVEMSVDNLLNSAPNIPLPIKLSILTDTCSGLEYLHGMDSLVVHRDLTARNILLTSSLSAKITDFGNSRLRLDQMAKTALSLPPEALNDSCRYGPSLDIFSFGYLSLYAITQGAVLDLNSNNLCKNEMQSVYICQHDYSEKEMLVNENIANLRKQFHFMKEEGYISSTRKVFRNNHKAQVPHMVNSILKQRTNQKEGVLRGPRRRASVEMENGEFLFPFLSILGIDNRAMENLYEKRYVHDGLGDLVNSSMFPASAYLVPSKLKVTRDYKVKNIVETNEVAEKKQDIVAVGRGDQVAREEYDYSIAVHHSSIAGFRESIVDKYRDAFKSAECKDGVRCMRHADIPGLFKTLIFSKSQCSSLEVSDKRDAGAIRTIAVVDFHSHRISHRTKPSKADIRSSQLTTDYAQIQVKGGSYEPVATNRGKSSAHITNLSYGSNKSLIDSVTPLLHAQAFAKIVRIIDPHLVGGSDDQGSIPLLFISGLSHFKLVNYNVANARFLRCDEVCLTFSKPGDSALCNLYLGDIKFSSRHYLEACSHYQNATSRYSTDTVAAQFRMVPPSLSAIHAKHGSALRNGSKMVDAIQEYKLAIKEAKTDKDRLAANTSLGNLYQSLGENTSALSHYERSVELSEKLHDYVSLGWAHGNMGNAYLGLFQKDKALFNLQKSLELTVVHEPTPQAIGRTYNNLGTAYQSLGDLDKAQEQYDYALSQAVYGNDRAGQARVYGNMGNVLMLRKKYEEAVPQYTEVLQLSKDRSTLSTAHHNRGCAYYEWGETKMEERYGEHVGIKDTSDDSKQQDGVTKSTVMEAKYYVHGPEFKDVSRFQPRKVTIDIAKYYGSGCDDLNEVVKFHEDHLDNIKGSSKGLTLSVSLFETNSRTFHRLQDCLVNLGEYVKALLVAEQSRARTLGELMLKRKGWYLQNPLTSPMPFDQIVANVGCIEHPVLYLSYTGARLLGWVFVSKQDGVTMNMFEVPLKDDQFDGKSFDYHLRYSLTEALVERSFEMYREVGGYDEDTSAPVQTLYNLIAIPLLAILEKCEASDAHKLVVITDSYTALLPFSSLQNPKTESFLGDRFSFQLMPSFLTMSILNQLSDINVVNLPTDAHNMCIVGNPNIPQFKYNDEIWNLGKLPHAKREAESVAHIMKTTPILEAQATKSAVLMRIMNAKIIHLATHGSASSGFLAFGMLVPLGQDRAANAQGVLLYPEEVEKLNINPALVVLSSCDSGRGAVKADGIQGMARAFILAGARAVLTTLWRVPDESAAVFMQFFYQYMMDGLESTKALQRAILSIRCFSKYSQYIHWSGYQLTGRDIYLKYAIPEETHTLEKRLGKNNVFPRLQDVKLLESDLVDATCYPTDVQIFESTPGLDAHEIVIDFIHNSYKHFSSGIYWISCEQPDFVTGSLKYIEKIIGGALEKLQLSELQQCLFIFDGISELPTSESLLLLMANRYTHCIMLYQQCVPPDNLIRSIDHKLLRGCKVHHIEPLSMILSTQRIVYAMQQETHFCPKSKDQMIIEKISNFTSGSPVLVNIVSQLLLSHLSNASQQLSEEPLADFAKSITLNITDEKHTSSPPSSLSSRSPSPTPSLSRQLCSSVSESLSSISILAPECRDEWDTPDSYDSWDSIAGLLSSCQFDIETKLLLDCLSHLGCGPIPLSIIASLSTLITKTSGRTHLAGSLLNQLMDKGFVKLYPSPVVIHSNLKQENYEFVYVPKYIADYMLKELVYPDKAVALATCFHTLSHAALPYSSVVFGLLKSLLLIFELNSDLMGETCYGEVYRLYLSLI